MKSWRNRSDRESPIPALHCHHIMTHFETLIPLLSVTPSVTCAPCHPQCHLCSMSASPGYWHPLPPHLGQTDTYWVENLGDKSCFHQIHYLGLVMASLFTQHILISCSLIMFCRHNILHVQDWHNFFFSRKDMEVRQVVPISIYYCLWHSSNIQHPCVTIK